MPLSFAHEVKSELCSIRPEGMCCKKASLYGLLLFARSFSPTGITLQTENQDVVSLVMELLRELFRIVPAFKTARRSDGHRTNILTLDDPNSAKIIYESFGYDQRTVALRINRANIENECCSASFLRGVFLSCGSIVDPGKDYHLEFASPHMQLARDLMAYLSELDFHPKMVGRQGGSVIYFKESEQIEDMLTIMGAVRQSLELMNVKVYKDLRNKVNRVTNCETANIGKTVAASSEQVEAIKKILKQGGFDSLPEELREIAMMRLENPDATLRELGGMLRVRLSRSGVNHRLKKIIGIAEKIRG